MLARPLYGYRTRWDGTDLLLEIRRAPSIDRVGAAQGRRIALDPGHPPGGATGPTGLREAEANLAIALQLQRLLQAAGATVIMTRTTDAPLDLGPRIMLAESAGCRGAGLDPQQRTARRGESFHQQWHVRVLQPRGEPASRTVCSAAASCSSWDCAILEWAGVTWPLVRPTWQPSILTEGLYMIVPEQEAALRSTEGQRRYAQGVLDGLRAWLLAIARQEM